MGAEELTPQPGSTSHRGAELIPFPTRPRYRKPTCIPTAIASLLVQLRGERGRRASVERYSHPAKPADTFRSVRLPDSDVTLVVPSSFDLSADLPPIARSILTPGLIRTYTLGWSLAEEARRSRGSFQWDDELISELLGLELHLGADGRKRISGKLRNAMHADLETLGRIYIVAPSGNPEPLIQRATTERVHVYTHSPTLWSMAVGKEAKDFVQVPPALLALDAVDVPIGFGLAVLWRQQITGAIEGPGYYPTTLAELAARVGEDAAAGLRRMGPPYWSRLAERIERVSHDALLGWVHVDGTGPGAAISAWPSETLKHAYQPLKERAEKRGELAHEAAIRSLAETPKRAPVRAKRRRRR